MKGLNIIIVTGLSGAGKSTCLKCLEDIGFYCVDNLPSVLIPKFVELCVHSNEISKAALGVDVREKDFLEGLDSIITKLKKNYKVEIVFLEASEDILLRRFKETRRPHPLSPDKPIIEGIKIEKKVMEELRDMADRIIDTSSYSVHKLRDALIPYYASGSPNRRMNISLISFSYRDGIPYDADLLFDVRFLPNPFFVEGLNHLSGNDKRVVDYVMSKQESTDFFKRLYSMLDFLLPLYERESKSYLTIAVGCTGGRHRSVVVVNELKGYFECKGYNPVVQHRDIGDIDK